MADERKHYIDDLRWITLLILVPYHTAMAWNTWNEPYYIRFGANRVISSFVVLFSPFFMPLLFLLAGVSTRFSLKKRTRREYVSERAKRLLIPLLFGTVAFMPVMTYLADKANDSYSGGFLRHYAVFFTRFTDLSGADGGFSLGQFWFLLYLFVISAVGAAVLPPLQKRFFKERKRLPFPLVCALGAPLPLLAEVLSVGGKSLAEFFWLFALGFLVFSEDDVLDKTERYAPVLSGIGLAADFLGVYLFIWSPTRFETANTVCKYLAEWFMTLALIGLAKRSLGSGGRFSKHMSRISFMFYSFHFVWVVVFLYILDGACGSTAVIFFGTTGLSYAAAFICCEISIKIPALRFLTGTK